MTVTTMTTSRSAPRTAHDTTGTWYAHAADAPPTAPGRHISTSRAWASAWEQVTTEPVIAHRHLHLTDGTGPGDLVSYYLVKDSPYWAAVERDAAIGPVFHAPVVYAGTPYGEYGGAGSASADTIRYAVSAGVDLVREWGAQALVVPGLTTDLAHRWTAACRPDADLFFDLAHVAPVHGSLEGFLTTVPSAKHAKEMRRQRRRGLEQGLRFRPLHGRAMLPYLPQFTDLAEAAACKNGGSMYGADIFTAVADIPGALLLAAEHDGDLVGGFLCFHYREVLYLWAAGIDYPKLRTLHTYTGLMLAAVDLAAVLGATTIDAGRANYRYKRTAGFHPVALRTLAYFPTRDPATARALHTMGHAMEACAGLRPAA